MGAGVVNGTRRVAGTPLTRDAALISAQASAAMARQIARARLSPSPVRSWANRQVRRPASARGRVAGWLEECRERGSVRAAALAATTGVAFSGWLAIGTDPAPRLGAQTGGIMEERQVPNAGAAATGAAARRRDLRAGLVKRNRAYAASVAARQEVISDMRRRAGSGGAAVGSRRGLRAWLGLAGEVAAEAAAAAAEEAVGGTGSPAAAMPA